MSNRQEGSASLCRGRQNLRSTSHDVQQARGERFTLPRTSESKKDVTRCPTGKRKALHFVFSCGVSLCQGLQNLRRTPFDVQQARGKRFTLPVTFESKQDRIRCPTGKWEALHFAQDFRIYEGRHTVPNRQVGSTSLCPGLQNL